MRCDVRRGEEKSVALSGKEIAMASHSLQLDCRPINSFLFEFNYMQKPWTPKKTAFRSMTGEQVELLVEPQDSAPCRPLRQAFAEPTGSAATNDDHEDLGRCTP